MDRPFACAFCGAPLDPGGADALMGLVDCAACGKLAQLTDAAVAALAAPGAQTKTISLAAPACPRCERQYTRPMLAPPYGIARCDCGAIGDLGAQYRAAKARLARAPPVDEPRPPTRLPNPGTFEVRERPGALEISWRTSTRGDWAAAVAAVALHLMVFLPLRIELGPSALWWASFVAASAALAYGIAYAASTVYVEATKAGLLTGRRPARWPARRLARADVAQLFVKHEVVVDRFGREHPYWWLAAVHRRTGQTVLVTPWFRDPSLPRFLERELERYLGIENQPVAGEHRPD